MLAGTCICLLQALLLGISFVPGREAPAAPAAPVPEPECEAPVEGEAAWKLLIVVLALFVGFLGGFVTCLLLHAWHLLPVAAPLIVERVGPAAAAHDEGQPEGLADERPPSPVPLPW